MYTCTLVGGGVIDVDRFVLLLLSRVNMLTKPFINKGALERLFSLHLHFLLCCWWKSFTTLCLPLRFLPWCLI